MNAPAFMSYILARAKAVKKAPIRLVQAVARVVRGRYDAAQTTRDNARHWAQADGLSPDAAANESVRRTLRQRCRYEVMNNSYAKGLVMMLANDTIGTGPRLNVTFQDEAICDMIERDFSRWAENIHLARKLREMRKARCQDGETFAIIVNNPRLINSIKLDLAVIEADRVRGEFSTLEDETSVDGIEYDKYGNPLSYRVLKNHPGSASVTSTEDAFTVKADYMLHMLVHDRPEMHRGVPELTPALPLFAQLRRYNLAVLAAAEAAADFSAVMYTDTPPDGETTNIAPLDSIPLERNMMLTIPAGWKLGQLDAKQPTATHTEFVKAILAEIARCVCSTYGSVAGDFSGFNYASGRLDNQIYHKAIIVDRSQWEEDVLNPLFRQWFREWQLVRGHVVPEEEIEHSWFWDGFMHVDPTKEANAAQTRLSTLTSTLAREYASQGMDWKREVEQRAREVAKCKGLGLAIQDGQQPAPPPEDEDDEASPAPVKKTQKEARNARK